MTEKEELKRRYFKYLIQDIIVWIVIGGISIGVVAAIMIYLFKNDVI